MLELRHIVKKYDEKVILDDISLTVEDGEIISILGPSGRRQDDAAERHFRNYADQRRSALV